MKTIIHQDDEVTTYRVEKGEQVHIDAPIAVELSLVAIHMKPDGTLSEQPSFVFEMKGPAPVMFVAQISLDKIWPAIEAAIKSKGPLS